MHRIPHSLFRPLQRKFTNGALTQMNKVNSLNSKKMESSLHLQIATDPDYEHPFAEIYKGKQQIGIFHQENGPGKFQLELFNKTENIILSMAELNTITDFVDKKLRTQ